MKMKKSNQGILSPRNERRALPKSRPAGRKEPKEISSKNLQEKKFAWRNEKANEMTSTEEKSKWNDKHWRKLAK